MTRLTDETFVARWARLKKAGSRPRKELADGDLADGAATSKPLAAIDLSTVNADFDIAAVLQAAVPEATRLAALRQFWSSCPDLFKPDGLDVYCEDYNAPTFQLLPALRKAVETATENLAEVNERDGDAIPGNQEPMPKS